GAAPSTTFLSSRSSIFRDFGIGAQILRDIGVGKIRWLTNNPLRLVSLPGYGLEIVEWVPLSAGAESAPRPGGDPPPARVRPLRLYSGRVRFTARLEGTPAADAAPLRARLRYQACNDSRCLPPRTLELVARDERGATNEDRGAATVAGGRVSDWIEQSGYALTFLWVAFLRLALNLTPCVYPLISVTIAFFGGSTGAVGRPVGRAVACC